MCQGRLTPGIGVGHPSFNDENPYYSGYINTLRIGAMTITYRREPMGVYRLTSRKSSGWYPPVISHNLTMFASCVHVRFAFPYEKMWISGKLPVLKDVSFILLGQISNLHEGRLRQEAFATTGRFHNVWTHQTSHCKIQ